MLQVLVLVAWPSPAFADTRLSVDDFDRGLLIRVEADAPSVIELVSDNALPIRWDRQGSRQALLPAITLRSDPELTVLDRSGAPHTLAGAATLPRIVIDPARYAQDAWRGEPSFEQRLRVVGLGLLFSLGLLLVLLIRRHALLASILYCLAWSAGLVLTLASRSDLLWSTIHPELPVKRLYAREPATLRLPIHARSGLCLPIVESLEHLKSLSARVEVRGEEAELIADLPRGAKLYLTSIPHADRILEDQR